MTRPDAAAVFSAFIYRTRQLHLVLAVLFVAVLVLQVFFAGLGVLVSPRYFALHTGLGHLVSLPIFALFIVGLLGRCGWRSLSLSAALFFLYGLQYAFLEGGEGPVRALHAVNALLMFWLSLRLVARSRQGVRAAAPAQVGQGRGGSFGRVLAGVVLILAGAVVLFGVVFDNGPGLVGTALLSSVDRPNQGTRAVSSEGTAAASGGELFARNCSGCHGASGEGRIGPALTGNDGLADTGATVRQILAGGGGMPGFGSLSDEEVAAVAAFVRSSWGNGFGPVTAAAVVAVR